MTDDFSKPTLAQKAEHFEALRDRANDLAHKQSDIAGEIGRVRAERDRVAREIREAVSVEWDLGTGEPPDVAAANPDLSPHPNIPHVSPLTVRQDWLNFDGRIEVRRLARIGGLVGQAAEIAPFVWEALVSTGRVKIRPSRESDWQAVRQDSPYLTPHVGFAVRVDDRAVEVIAIEQPEEDEDEDEDDN